MRGPGREAQEAQRQLVVGKQGRALNPRVEPSRLHHRPQWAATQPAAGRGSAGGWLGRQRAGPHHWPLKSHQPGFRLAAPSPCRASPSGRARRAPWADAALPQEAGTARSQHLGQVPCCRSPGERRGGLLVMLGEREPPSKTGNHSNPRGMKIF